MGAPMSALLSCLYPVCFPAPPPLRPSAVMATVAAASASAAPAPIRWAIVSCGKISHDFVNGHTHHTQWNGVGTGTTTGNSGDPLASERAERCELHSECATGKGIVCDRQQCSPPPCSPPPSMPHGCSPCAVCVAAIRHLSDVLIVACAARSLDDAQAFAKLFNIPRAYGSYAELVADASVQVCYIGSLHPQHADLSTLCLEGGKHVLCEKPFAVTARDAESVVALAHRKGLFVMEAMWSRFVPSIVRAREILASGVLGEVKVVQAPFGFRMAPDTPRLWENKHAGGATLDLGVYPIALASMVFSAGGTVEPSRITAAGELSQDEKIDTQLSITLQYGSGQMAVLHCSMLATLPNEAYIIGTRGWLRLDAHSHWHCTQRLTLHLDDQPVDQVFDFPEPKRADQFEFKFVDSQLMVHECREVNRCIRAGATESSVHSNREAIAIARIMDEVRRQVGVVYAEDKKQ